MRYVNLKNTDLVLSNICMGTVYFGSTVPMKEAFRRLDRFAEMGGNFLDTAAFYAVWLPGVEESTSEIALGKWMKERRNHNDVVVATKGGVADPGIYRRTMSREELTKEINTSRCNLGLDTIPLYYLHRDDPAQTVEQIMDSLFSFQDKGWLGNIACSNWKEERVRAANDYAIKCGRTGFVAVSNRWSLARFIEGSGGDDTLADMNDKLYRFHCETGIASIPYTSTATGYLSKLDRGEALSEMQRSCYGIPENDALLLRAREIADSKGVSIAQLALCWFYNHPFQAIPITAFSSDAQMDEAVMASEIVLTQEEFNYLNI